MKWEDIKLGKLVDIKHGFAFKGDYFVDQGEFIVLTPGNCHESGGIKLKGDKEKYYSGEFPGDFLLKSGDLLVVMTDLVNSAPILGGAFIIPEDNRFLHNQRLGLVQIIDDKRIDKKFLFYLLNTPSYRAQVRGSASGATVRHTSPSRIKDCIVGIPLDIMNQREIADILSAYDDLIENNTRQTQLLEEAAVQLYKEWFVRLRFPGHEQVKVVDGLPEGWLRSPLAVITQIIKRGITPSYDNDADWLVINQKCIRNGRLNANLARRQSKEVKSDRVLLLGDVLINSTGEGTLGRVAQIKEVMERFTVDTHVTIVRPKSDIPTHYFGLAVMEWEPRFSTMGRGATNQTELSPTAIAETPILLPTASLLEEFEAFADPIYEQVNNLVAQNNKLSQARDLLLPRLMNGEIRV